MKETELKEPACRQAAESLNKLKLAYMCFQHMINEHDMRDDERAMFESIEVVIKTLDTLFDCVALSTAYDLDGNYSLILDDNRLATNSLPITKEQAEALFTILCSKEHMDVLGY